MHCRLFTPALLVVRKYLCACVQLFFSLDDVCVFVFHKMVGVFVAFLCRLSNIITLYCEQSCVFLFGLLYSLLLCRSYRRRLVPAENIGGQNTQKLWKLFISIFGLLFRFYAKLYGQLFISLEFIWFLYGYYPDCMGNMWIYGFCSIYLQFFLWVLSLVL